MCTLGIFIRSRVLVLADSDGPAGVQKPRGILAAIDLADTGGEALSMRKLGQELVVEATSLYNHVANKDDLLDAIGLMESRRRPGPRDAATPRRGDRMSTVGRLLDRDGRALVLRPGQLHVRIRPARQGILTPCLEGAATESQSPTHAGLSRSP